MNTNEIPGWLDQHGGADGPPQTDANGVTTHRARDGSYVTVYAGQVRMIGHSSPSDQTDQTAPAQPAQRPGGGMDQAALEARIAELQRQYPGLKFMGRSVKEKNRSRLDEETGRTVTETVSVPVVQWIDPSTGYTLTAEVGAGGGTYTVTDDRIMPDNKGEKQAGGFKEGDTRGPQTGKKREVFRSGQWVTEDNPLYEPDKDPSRAPNITTSTINGQRFTTQVTPGVNGQPPKIEHFGPDGKPVAALPTEVKPGDSKTETKVGADGRIYTRVTTISADGQTTAVKNFGPDGKQVSEIPGEGPSTPRTAGPALPQIVLGNSQEALRTYKQQLQEGVASGRWSQAWADARWGEAIQVANTAVQEAATLQRDAESTRNAAFNIAQQKQNAMTTATNNALSFVDRINGSLPEGSPLGGQAFAALLGLQMLQANLSGINSIDPRARPPQLTPADLQNPQALAAKRDEIGQAIATATPTVIAATDANIARLTAPRPAAPAAPAAPAPPSPPPSSIVPNGTPNPGPVPGQDASVWQPPIEPAPAALGSAPAPEPAPAPPEMPPPPPLGEAGQAVAEVGTVVVRNRLTGAKRILTRPQWEAEQANPSLLAAGDRWLWEVVEGAQPDTSVPPIQGPMTEEAAPAPEPQPTGGAFPPLPVVPRAGTEAGGNVQKVMPSEWQALQGVMPQPSMPAAQPQVGMPQMGGEPVAVRRARIASSPPWRLSEDDIAWAEQNGLGNEAWAIPGRGAA